MSILRNLVNVDMIESFMDINNLSITAFCKLCKISVEELDQILNRQLTSIPYFMDEIANIINVPLKYLVNFDLMKKYFPIFKH